MRLPKVASAQEWRAARLELLTKEKELTRHRDAVATARRELPMVEVTEPYAFDGPAGGNSENGETTLAEVFEGRRQLLIYHAMFEPDDDEACPSCTFIVDNIGPQAHLHARNTTLAVVSRAPLDKLTAYRKRMGWDDITWYSSGRSRFNLDFGVTYDPAEGVHEYNFRDRSADPAWHDWRGEQPGVSAFVRDDDGRVFHTYSAYERAVEALMGTYTWLDLTALGRQEDWEQPPGNGDGPGLSWLRRHDEYGQQS